MSKGFANPVDALSKSESRWKAWFVRDGFFCITRTRRSRKYFSESRFARNPNMKEKPYIWNTSQGTTQSRLKLTGKRKSFIEHMRGEGYNITALDLIDKVICYDSMRADELPNWVLIEIRNATVQRLNGSGKVKTM